MVGKGRMEERRFDQVEKNATRLRSEPCRMSDSAAACLVVVPEWRCIVQSLSIWCFQRKALAGCHVFVCGAFVVGMHVDAG